MRYNGLAFGLESNLILKVEGHRERALKPYFKGKMGTEMTCIVRNYMKAWEVVGLFINDIEVSYKYNVLFLKMKLGLCMYVEDVLSYTT